jgi:hypothetical protein
VLLENSHGYDGNEKIMDELEHAEVIYFIVIIIPGYRFVPGMVANICKVVRRHLEDSVCQLTMTAPSIEWGVEDSGAVSELRDFVEQPSIKRNESYSELTTVS